MNADTFQVTLCFELSLN